MIPGEVFGVLLVLALCVPVFIMLIHLELNEKRIKELELMVWSLLPDEPRAILEADLPPTEEEVSVKNG